MLEADFSPLDGMDYHFSSYLRNKERKEQGHMSGNGLPDYGFDLDYELRKKLDSIPNLYRSAQTIVGTYASQQIRKCNLSMLAVGPKQFSEVYQVACDCARILGIGIPNVFIMNNPAVDAYTIATDDIEPVIVVYSGLLERFSLGELRCVIGHECGHIHNQHSIYQTAVQLFMGVLSSSTDKFSMGRLLSASSVLLLKAWSRASEVTADRAAMICSENLEDAYHVNAKLLYGAAFGERQINYEAIREQLEDEISNPSKYYELTDTHPTASRRIAAQQEFAECETLYKWRPELRSADLIMRTRAETEARCRRYLRLSQSERAGDRE